VLLLQPCRIRRRARSGANETELILHIERLPRCAFENTIAAGIAARTSNTPALSSVLVPVLSGQVLVLEDESFRDGCSSRIPTDRSPRVIWKLTRDR
jgi:hypothetical protein